MKTSKKVFSLLLAVLMLALTASAAFAVGGSDGGILNWNYDEEQKVLTISGKGAMKDFNDPYHTPWYSACSYACKSLVIESGVWSIGSYAFSLFSSLENITISETVREIGAGAFESCTALKTLSIPGTVEIIGDSAFAKCGRLETVKLGKGIETIEKAAFAECNSLTEISISEYVKTIGAQAFKDCRWLETVSIPVSVKTIGDSAFYNCVRLKAINYGGTKQEWNRIKFGKNVFKCVNKDNSTYEVKPAISCQDPQIDENTGDCPFCGGEHKGFPGILIGFIHKILAKLGFVK